LSATGWLFVYACPSVVREWYGTRTEPSESFPEGILDLSRRNPERRNAGDPHHHYTFTVRDGIPAALTIERETRVIADDARRVPPGQSVPSRPFR
jgi:hypothetical protein